MSIKNHATIKIMHAIYAYFKKLCMQFMHILKNYACNLCIFSKSMLAIYAYF